MAEPYDVNATNGDKHQQHTKHEQGDEEESEVIYGDDDVKHRDYNNSKDEDDSVSLYAAIMALMSPIFFPDSNGRFSSISFINRVKESMKENVPRLREAFRNTGVRVCQWAREGSALRLLLVVSVGTITLLTLTGILVSLLFVAAATINAIIISLFMSLAAAGGFLAMFFACIAVIYVGALSVAVFVIASATVSAIITVSIVTGWIGFFWIVWMSMRKSVHFAKRSVTVTGSAVSAYTSAWQARRHSD